MGCENSETAEPIDTKFDMGDYVGDVTYHATVDSAACYCCCARSSENS